MIVYESATASLAAASAAPPRRPVEGAADVAEAFATRELPVTEAAGPPTVVKFLASRPRSSFISKSSDATAAAGAETRLRATAMNGTRNRRCIEPPWELKPVASHAQTLSAQNEVRVRAGEMQSRPDAARSSDWTPAKGFGLHVSLTQRECSTGPKPNARVRSRPVTDQRIADRFFAIDAMRGSNDHIASEIWPVACRHKRRVDGRHRIRLETTFSGRSDALGQFFLESCRFRDRTSTESARPQLRG